MANEILYTTLGDLRLPAVLAGEIDLLLADRSYLWGNPALLYRGDAGARGSDTVKYPSLGLGGYDEMAAVAENAAVVPTQLTDASVTLAVARQAIARTMSDLARITDPMGGRINVSALAADIVASAYARFTSMIAALGGGFSSTAGATGVNLSVDNWFTAVAVLELANVAGPYVATLHSVQIADLRTSLRAETGVMQYQPATAEVVQRTGQMAVGTLLGVDIMRINRTPTANAGADRAGMMWGQGAIHWADAAVPGVPGIPPGLLTGGRISVGVDRDNLGALTSIVGDYYVGVGIRDTAAGVNITTDA